MLLYAVSVLVVAQSSSEIPEGLMNNPVYLYQYQYQYQESSRAEFLWQKYGHARAEAYGNPPPLKFYTVLGQWTLHASAGGFEE